MTIPGVGVHRFSNTWAHGSHSDQYSFMICARDNIDLAAAEPGTSVIYVSWETDPTDSGLSTPVSFARCSANGWLVSKGDGTGGTLSTPGFPTSRVTRIDNPDYQAAWIEAILATLAAHPVDGVFIDIVIADLHGYGGGNGEGADYPFEYPTQASWEAAMLSFVIAVSTALRDAGFLCVLNAHKYIAGNSASDTGATNVEWFAVLAPYVSGLMAEYWLQDHSVPDTTFLAHLMSNSHVTYNDHWDTWLLLHDTCNGVCAFYPLFRSNPNLDTVIASWARANFLLKWDGSTGAVIYKTPATVDPWDACWTADVGTPKGAMFGVGVGYRRNYTKGAALVNPHTSASQTFHLGGEYQNTDGDTVTSVTLAAKHAQILTVAERPASILTQGDQILTYNGNLVGAAA